MTILATKPCTNADLMIECMALGYVPLIGDVLDPTYGEGGFWRLTRPSGLVTCDLKPGADLIADFTQLPFDDDRFDSVVFDPPYKLNGTPSMGKMDERYGVEEPTNWRERHDLMVRGLNECARVLKSGGHLLVKCQDQVCSGKVRWQTDLMTSAARLVGLEKIDRFDLVGHRPQPAGRRQVHARRNSSQLLVFR